MTGRSGSRWRAPTCRKGHPEDVREVGPPPQTVGPRIRSLHPIKFHGFALSRRAYSAADGLRPRRSKFDLLPLRILRSSSGRPIRRRPDLINVLVVNLERRADADADACRDLVDAQGRKRVGSVVHSIAARNVEHAKLRNEAHVRASCANAGVAASTATHTTQSASVLGRMFAILVCVPDVPDVPV